MQYILHRLVMASVDSQLRQDMNVEDEYFQAIEDRDTAIMSRDKQIKEKDQQLSQKDKQLSQKDQQLSQKDQQLSQKDQQLSQKDQQLSQKDQQLSQKEQQLSQKDQQLNRVREKLRQQGLSEKKLKSGWGNRVAYCHFTPSRPQPASLYQSSHQQISQQGQPESVIRHGGEQSEKQPKEYSGR